jgi:hypothetical protein
MRRVAEMTDVRLIHPQLKCGIAHGLNPNPCGVLGNAASFKPFARRETERGPRALGVQDGETHAATPPVPCLKAPSSTRRAFSLRSSDSYRSAASFLALCSASRFQGALSFR